MVQRDAVPDGREHTLTCEVSNILKLVLKFPILVRHLRL